MEVEMYERKGWGKKWQMVQRHGNPVRSTEIIYQLYTMLLPGPKLTKQRHECIPCIPYSYQRRQLNGNNVSRTHQKKGIPHMDASSLPLQSLRHICFFLY